MPKEIPKKLTMEYTEGLGMPAWKIEFSTGSVHHPAGVDASTLYVTSSPGGAQVEMSKLHFDPVALQFTNSAIYHNLGNRAGREFEKTPGRVTREEKDEFLSAMRKLHPVLHFEMPPENGKHPGAIRARDQILKLFQEAYGK